MALEFVDDLRPRDFFRESTLGYEASMSYTPTNDLGGLALPKLASQGYIALSEIPGALTVATGLTFKVAITDDGMNAADLGKVVRIGLTVKRIVSGTDDLDVDTGAATETATDITLDTGTGQVVVTAIAIANAALDSLATGEAFALRVRRIATHANDTCNGRAILLGVFIRNT